MSDISGHGGYCQAWGVGLQAWCYVGSGTCSDATPGSGDLLLSYLACKPLTLAQVVRRAVEPVLKGLSDYHNQTAWSFAYRDVDTSVSFCVGYSDLASRAPCSAGDLYAWGSATKTHTALLILQMTEAGYFKLDDALVSLANDYLRAISNGKSDLIRLFGPQVYGVTVRQLLQMTAGIPEYGNAKVRAYQNFHRQDDLSPMWILNHTNHKLKCVPGTCGEYSDTNYVLLGLVAARFQHASSWDTLDQRAWMQRIPGNMRARSSPEEILTMSTAACTGPTRRSKRLLQRTEPMRPCMATKCLCGGPTAQRSWAALPSTSPQCRQRRDGHVATS